MYQRSIPSLLWAWVGRIGIPGVLVCILCGQVFGASPEISPGVTERVLAAAYVHKVPEADVRIVLDAVHEAARDSVPAEPLVRKIEEGFAKRIPGSRIASAVMQMGTLFDTLSRILDRVPATAGHDREARLQRLAALVNMGVETEELARRLEANSGHALEEKLNALEFQAAFVAAGMPRGVAAQAYDAGLVTGYFEKPAWGLVRVVREIMVLGAAQTTIAEQTLRVVSGQKSLRDMARENGLDYDSVVSGRGRSGSVSGQGRGVGAGKANGSGLGRGDGGHGGGNGNGGGGRK